MSDDTKSPFENPMDQTGGAVTDPPILGWTTLRKKVGENSYATINITIKDTNDNRFITRMQGQIAAWQNVGYEHADPPQRTFGGGGGGGKPGGQTRRPKIDPPEDGRFTVDAFDVFKYNDKANVHAIAHLEAGDIQVADWEGRQLKAAQALMQNKFADWETWEPGVEHPVTFETHKVVAVATKSATGKWSIKSYEVVAK
jgi:hypothetical protein